MSVAARIALALVTLALILLLLSGPGARFGLWEFRTGFTLMRWAVYIAVAGAGLGLVTLVALLVSGSKRAGAWVARTALLLGLAVAYVPWSMMQQARALPPIHDISTDTTEVPVFVALLPARQAAHNGFEYAGEEIALQQRQAYPDLQPLRLSVAPAEAFARALAAVESLGLEVVATEAAEGRIEATATTFWYGFKDDVVIRVRAEDSGSRVDIRSMSRIGRGDVGANAKRIRALLGRIGGGD